MDLFELIRQIIVDECNVEPNAIRTDTNIVEDLGIDSLDILRVVYRLDEELNVQIPVQKWLNDIGQNGAPPEQYFVVASFCQKLQGLLEQRAAG